MIVLLGDRIKQRTSATGKVMEGIVVAVNYPHGWYTLEFTTTLGKFRESFYMRQLRDEQTVERTGKSKTYWSNNPNMWLEDDEFRGT